MTGLKLVVFDVDGTLVDSQGDILASMTAAFAAAGLPAPSRATVLGIVGLSLPVAMEALAPDEDAPTHARMVEAYKECYTRLRATGGASSSPLYPGIGALLGRLRARDDLLLGVATGKSRRGLTALIDSLNLGGTFVTTQVADDHPSKPNPAMLLACLSETGVAARDAVMIGDTAFDMQMACDAGVRAIGVDWGYHHPQELVAAGAEFVAETPAELGEYLLR